MQAMEVDSSILSSFCCGLVEEKMDGAAIEVGFWRSRGDARLKRWLVSLKEAVGCGGLRPHKFGRKQVDGTA